MPSLSNVKPAPTMTGTRMTPQELSKSGSEHGHQRAFYQELQVWSPVIYDMTFAIPNGGKRGDTARSSMIRGAAMKAEGVKRGVPDSMVAWPFGGYAGLFIEQKRPSDRDKDRAAGRLGTAQEPWHDRLRARGYKVVIAYTWEEALDHVKRYFGAI